MKDMWTQVPDSNIKNDTKKSMVLKAEELSVYLFNNGLI